MRLRVLLLVLLLVTAACAKKQVPSATGKQIKQLPAETVPAKLGGLAVAQEDVGASITLLRRSYAQSIGLWVMRRGDNQVQATLEIVKFFDDERYRSSSFRRTVANQLGGTAPKETKMGDVAVYRTTGTQQSVALWFKGDAMFLLSTRQDFSQPRALIREALGIAA